MKKAVMLASIVLLGLVVAWAQTGTGSSSSSTQSSSLEINNGPVAEVVSDSSATLGWSVSSAAGSMSIKYGTDRDHMNQTADATASSDGRNFHARLSNLSPETRYYFQVTQNGSKVGGVGTFRTTAAGAPPIKSRATIPQ
jgi:phosphodiesterase/alkaline phosphatase D-like protein